MFIKYEKFMSIYFLIQKLLVSLSCNKIKSSMKKSNRNYLLKYRNVTIDRFEIVKFFSYTSTIMCGDDLIFEIDGWREDRREAADREYHGDPPEDDPGRHGAGGRASL